MLHSTTNTTFETNATHTIHFNFYFSRLLSFGSQGIVIVYKQYIILYTPTYIHFTLTSLIWQTLLIHHVHYMPIQFDNRHFMSTSFFMWKTTENDTKKKVRKETRKNWKNLSFAYVCTFFLLFYLVFLLTYVSLTKIGLR